MTDPVREEILDKIDQFDNLNSPFIGGGTEGKIAWVGATSGAENPEDYFARRWR